MLVCRQWKPLDPRSKLTARAITNAECRKSPNSIDMSLIQATLMTEYSSNLSVPRYFVGAPQRITGYVLNHFLNVIVCLECDPKLGHIIVTSYNFKPEIDLNNITWCLFTFINN
jgi:hypothetical protein